MAASMSTLTSPTRKEELLCVWHYSKIEYLLGTYYAVMGLRIGLSARSGAIQEDNTLDNEISENQYNEM
ncbi:hypothetical protein BKA67DRAFT_579281, partial [Truncatella angustata]